jgi:uncharacterized protein YdeI (YjbR/CyaY-like superfamily)
MGDMLDGLEVRSFADAATWETWLDDHHADRAGVWIRIARKGSGYRSIDAAEGTQIALCFGWIDGQRRRLDETHFLQKYTPRRRRSLWSRINRDRAEALIAAGRMRRPGLDQIAAARADGRWERAYGSQRVTTVPPDLDAALRDETAAQVAFDALGRTDRYLLILTLLKARTENDRSARLARIIAELGRPEVRRGPAGD